MGFRFQKRIKILPGVRLNLSKSGASTSLGGKGATVNYRKGKTKMTLGLPGSGLSHSQEFGGKKGRAIPQADRGPPHFSAFLQGLVAGAGWPAIIFFALIFIVVLTCLLK